MNYNNLFIREIKLNNKYSINGYVKYIKSIMNLDILKLKSNITFLVGENRRV